MRRLHATRVLIGIPFLAALALAADDPPAKAPTDAPAEKSPGAPEERLSISPPIACRAINGFEDYEVLPGAALTADEKLLVYFRPSGYHVEQGGGMYHIHMSQEGQIRRRGEKPVLMRKEQLLDYEWKTPNRPNPVYLRNTVALKGLKPGEYDFDIILHDRLGQRATATITLPFKVIPAVLPGADGDEDNTAEEPKPKAKPKARPKGRRSSR